MQKISSATTLFSRDGDVLVTPPVERWGPPRRGGPRWQLVLYRSEVGDADILAAGHAYEQASRKRVTPTYRATVAP